MHEAHAGTTFRTVTRQSEGNARDGWSLRVYMQTDDETGAELRRAIQTLRDAPSYAETVDEYIQRSDAEWMVNAAFDAAGVRAGGYGGPGQHFTDAPWIKCTGRRVIVRQSGGLDI